MNSMISTSVFQRLSSPLQQSSPYLYLQKSSCCSQGRNAHQHCTLSKFQASSRHSFRSLQSSIGATTTSNEEAVLVADFEDLMEKDWSFLEFDNIDSDGQYERNIKQIITTGEITESSNVLISIGSELFVDMLMNSSTFPSEVTMVHDSLLVLASIKEKYDNARCWQGELINLPENWGPFDVVFLYFLPGLPYELGQLLEVLAKHCSPGARIVISLPMGRQMIEQQRQQHLDVVVSNLPDEVTIKAAAENMFEIAKYTDQPDLYLVVLKAKAGNSVIS